MLLCAHQLFFEVVEDSLAKLIISRVLCQLRELQIVVDVI